MCVSGEEANFVGLANSRIKLELPYQHRYISFVAASLAKSLS